MKRFWRIVWLWHDGHWDMPISEPVSAWNPFQCMFGEPSWCQFSPPYLYEQWWQLVVPTWGNGVGTWTYIGARDNYSSNPVHEP